MKDFNLELFNQYAVEGEVPVLVDALEKIAEQYEGSLIVGKVNIDEVPELAQKEQIEVIPTLVLYKKGQALGSIVGPGSKGAISQFIDQTLGW